MIGSRRENPGEKTLGSRLSTTVGRLARRGDRSERNIRARGSDRPPRLPPRGSRTPLRARIRAIALALVMVLSLFAIGGLAASPAGASAPSGMVGMPSENIESDIPACENAQGQGQGDGDNPICDAAENLRTAGAYASAHPESLEIIVTNPGRAETQYSGGNIQGTGPVAIVFADDENHDGREVGISQAVLEEILGYAPAAAFGAHEDGDEWVRPIEYENGYAVIAIPGFSENTVTFSGSITLEGDPSEHGDQFTYTLDSLDGIENFEIEVTGHDATGWNNQSGLFGDGDTQSIEIGGTTDPVGPGTGGEPVIEIVGTETLLDEVFTGAGASDGDTESVTIDGDDDAQNAELTFTGSEIDGQSDSDSKTSQTDGDSYQIDVGGNIDPANADVTITGDTSTSAASESGSNMQDEDSFSIEVGGNDDPTSEEVTITGDTSTGSDSESEAGEADGGSFEVDVGGNDDPTSEEVTITGVRQETSDSTSGVDGTDNFNVDGNQVPEQASISYDYDDIDSGTESVTFSNSVKSSTLWFDVDHMDHLDYVEVEIDGDSPLEDMYLRDWDNSNIAGDPLEEGTYDLDHDVSGDDTIDLQLADEEGENDATVYVTLYEEPDDPDTEINGQTFTDPADVMELGSNSIDVPKADGQDVQWTLEWTQLDISEDPSISIDGDTVTYTGILDDGETHTESISLSPGTHTASVSMSHHVSDFDVSWTEVNKAENPEVSVGGNTVSYSGLLGDGETHTESIDLDTGSHLASFSLDHHQADVEVSWTEVTKTEDPSVSVDGETVATSGLLGDGETHSESVDISEGTHTVDVSMIEHEADIDISWTERIATEDPQATIDGQTVAHDGLIREGETETKPLDAISTGSQSIDFNLGAGSEVDWELDLDETHWTDSPMVDVNDDGTTEHSHSGTISPGDTVRFDADAIDENTDAIRYTTTGDTELEAIVRIEEVTETVDPTVLVNGEETGHTGTLADGDTEPLATNDGWLEEGENTVEIEMNAPASGPTPKVGFDYGHDADAASKTVTYESETWSQRYNVSNTWVGAQESAWLEVPMSSRVIDIRDLEVRTNETIWEPVDSEDYTLTETDLTVDLGDLDPDTKKEVRVNATKVSVAGGAIQVLTPTVEGDTVETELEITEVTGSHVEIDVSGTDSGDRLHYLSVASWDAGDPYAEIDSDGEQVVHLVDSPQGGTATVSEAPFEIGPSTGSVEAQVDDVDEPRFTLTNVSGDTDVTWTEATAGQTYELLLMPDEDGMGTATAGSPVTFTTDEDGTYTIGIYESTSGTTAAGAPIDEEPTGPIPSWVLLFGVVFLGVLGITLIASWLGDRREIRGPTLPVVGRRLPSPTIGGLTDTQSAIVMVGGIAVIGVLALEIVTADSLIPATIEAITAGIGVPGEFGAIFLGGALLIGLWWLDERTTQAIPQWILGAITGLWAIWTLETIRPGVLLGPLAVGFESFAPLFWMSIISGGLYLAYQWVQARGEPETEVVFQIDD